MLIDYVSATIRVVRSNIINTMCEICCKILHHFIFTYNNNNNSAVLSSSFSFLYTT